MKRKRFDYTLCAGAGACYLANRLCLQRSVTGWFSWFLRCYANDILAGLAMAAFLDLLLALGGRRPLRSPVWLALFLLLCGFVWEVLAPLWKAGAVFDLWDFAAYLAGGAAFLLIRATFEK